MENNHRPEAPENSRAHKKDTSARKFRIAMAATVFAATAAVAASDIKSSLDFDHLPLEEQLIAYQKEEAEPCIPPWLADMEYCADEKEYYQKRIEAILKELQKTSAPLATPTQK